MPNWIQLQLHAEIPNRLRWLDKRAPHVVIANESLPERNIRLRRIPDCRRDSRIGNRHHHIGIHRTLDRQKPPQHFPRMLHRTPEHNRIRPREIHMLEHTVRMIAHGRISFSSHAFRSDNHHLAWLDITQINRIDQIERASFRREYVASAPARKLHLPKRQRTKPMRIARDQHPVPRQKHQ